MTMTQTQSKAAELGGHDELELTALMANFKPADQDEDVQRKYRKIMRGTSGFQVDEGGYARLTESDALILVHFTPTDAVVLFQVEIGEAQTFQNDRDETITFNPRTVMYLCPLGHGQPAVDEGKLLIRDIKGAYLKVMARDLDGFGEAPPARGERGDEVPAGLE